MKNLLLLAFALLTTGLHAQYKSLFWKISGNGLSEPSFLFGTMHTSDPRIVKLSENAMPYFAKSKAYAMELDPAEAFNLGLISKLMMGKGYSLKTLVREPEYSMLDSMVKEQVGFPLSLFDNVAPVFVMTIIESASLGLNDSAGTAEVLDLHFYGEAKKNKKKVIGIETTDEQLSALNSLSYQEQADMLVKELDDMGTDTFDGPDLVRLYLEQKLDSVAAMDNTTSMPAKFYKALVTDRNIRMADRIAHFIKEKPTFIAIGALHLPDKGGVIELLRSKGFKVEEMKL
ncbi:MAG: TraB/GumN family protein [Chitinophagales bacterium]